MVIEHNRLREKSCRVLGLLGRGHVCLKCFMYEISLLQAQCSTPLAQGCVAFSVYASVIAALPDLHRLRRLSNEACSHLNLAFHWLRQDACHSSQFNPMPVCVEFVMDKAALGQISLQELWLLPVSVIAPIIYIYIYKTMCSGVLLGKLTGPPLVKTLPALYETQRG